MRGVTVGSDGLCLLGEDLPWADGVVYLGPDPHAPGVLFPTTRAPSEHPALVARALVARFGGPGPLAVVPSQRLVFPVGGATPVDADWIRRWLS